MIVAAAAPEVVEVQAFWFTKGTGSETMTHFVCHYLELCDYFESLNFFTAFTRLLLWFKCSNKLLVVVAYKAVVCCLHRRSLQNSMQAKRVIKCETEGYSRLDKSMLYVPISHQIVRFTVGVPSERMI